MVNFFKKFKSDIFIKIERYQPIVKKGKLKDTSKLFLKNLAEEYNIESGEIFAKNKNIDILGIDKSVHGKIKKIILNDHKYYF